MENNLQAEIKKITVQDIVDNVIEMIVKGEFLPGTPLREVELCQRFGISRTPVREALRLLQNNGVVEYIPRCGVQVVDLTMEDLIHITDLRISIEALSARKAAQNIKEEDIHFLREINLKFRDADDVHEHNRLDAEFHRYIAEISQNPFVVKHLEDLHIRQALARYLIPFRPGRIMYSYQEHENIIQALEWRDERLAAKQTEIHFYMSQRTLQQKLAEYEGKKTTKK